MYKIGDKVETPLGVGQIYNISDEEYSDFTVELFGYEKHIVTLCNVNVKGQSLLYKDTDLKPYRTAHEKLIEMGWECTDNENTHVVFRKTLLKNAYQDDFVQLEIIKRTKTFGATKYYNDNFNSRYSHHQFNFDLELSRIITDYLEEMEEK